MIELPLLKRYIEKEGYKPADELEELLCYFGSIGGDKIMEEVSERNPMISDLEALEMVYRMDPWKVRRFMLDKADQRYMEHMLRDKLEEGLKRGMKRGIKAGREEGRQEGRQEGIQEGRKEQALESARSLRTQGILTDEQIAHALNLSLETIQAL